MNIGTEYPRAIKKFLMDGNVRNSVDRNLLVLIKEDLESMLNIVESLDGNDLNCLTSMWKEYTRTQYYNEFADLIEQTIILSTQDYNYYSLRVLIILIQQVSISRFISMIKILNNSGTTVATSGLGGQVFKILSTGLTAGNHLKISKGNVNVKDITYVELALKRIMNQEGTNE